MDKQEIVIEIVAKFDDQTSQNANSAAKNVDRYGESIQKTKSRMESASGSNDRFGSSLEQTSSKAEKAQSKIGRLFDSVKGFAGKTISIGMSVIDKVTSPVRKIMGVFNSFAGLLGLGAGFTGAVVIPLKAEIETQNLETAFEVLLGSAEAAKKRIDELTDFAGSTPYTRDAIYQSSRILQTFTGDALSTGDGLRLIGDVAAGTQQDFQELSVWFGRLYDGIKNHNSIGEATARLQEMGAISGEARARLEELAKAPGDMDTRWKQATKEFEQYNGMMEKMSDNLGNLLLGVKSFVNNTFTKRIGSGLATGITPILQDFRKWRKENKDLINEIGDTVEKKAAAISSSVIGWTSKTFKRISETVNSSEFQNADFGGKIKILWSDVIATPFAEWWNSKGQAFCVDAADKIGHGLGSALKGGILAILGIDNEDTSSVVDGGISVGKAFAEGFLEGFDPGTVGNAILEKLKSMMKDSSKILPGGESPTTSSWVNTAILGYGAYKLGGKKLIQGLGKKIFTSKGASSVVNAADDVASAGTKNGGGFLNWIKKSFGSKEGLNNIKSDAEVLSGMSLASKKGPEYQKYWENVNLFDITKRSDAVAEYQKTFSNTTKNLARADKIKGMFSKAGNFFDDFGTKLLKPASKISPYVGKAKNFLKGNWLSLLFSGAAIWQAEDKVGETVKQGGGLAGGAAGGAAGAKLGTAIGGGIGALFGGVGAAPGAAIGGTLGTLIGSIFGYNFGEDIASALYDAKDSIAKFFTETVPTAWNDFWGGVGDFFTSTIPTIANDLKDGVDDWWSNTIVPGWNDFWGGVGDFFTETLPGWGDSLAKGWNSFWSGVGDFFTETIPGWAEKLGKRIDDFVDNTLIPGWNDFWSGVGDFFTKDVPYAIGYSIGKIEQFFTNTLPDAWNGFWSDVGDFFTETVPKWAEETWNDLSSWWNDTIVTNWNEFWGSVGDFFTETVPEWAENTWNDLCDWWDNTLIPGWNNFWGSVGDFFTETIPKWAEETWNDFSSWWDETIVTNWNSFWGSVGDFFTETVPKWAEETGERINTWFTETLPQKWDEFWTGVNEFVTEKIPSWIESIGKKISDFFDGIGNWVDEVVEGAQSWWSGVCDWAGKKWDQVTGNYNEGKNDAKKGYAVGTPSAIPGLHWVGERGPELVKFKGGERVYTAHDSRRIMSVFKNRAFANGSMNVPSGDALVGEKGRELVSENNFFNNFARRSGFESQNRVKESFKITKNTDGGIQIDVGGINFEINLTNADPENILSILKKNLPSIANELCEKIAIELKRVFINMPVGNA